MGLFSLLRWRTASSSEYISWIHISLHWKTAPREKPMNIAVSKWSIVLSEDLTVTQLVKRFPPFLKTVFQYHVYKSLLLEAL
jgi:hypothetical protein